MDNFVTPQVDTKKTLAKPAGANKKRKVVSIAVLVVGLIMLAVGVVFLVLKLMKGPEVQDGNFLISAENWVLDGESGVIWDFTEIGKGKLTTNGHTNDYDFIWALEDGKLLIETDWLYDLENEYEYKLDKGAGELLLMDGDKTIKFVGNFAAK